MEYLNPLIYNYTGIYFSALSSVDYASSYLNLMSEGTSGI